MMQSAPTMGAIPSAFADLNWLVEAGWALASERERNYKPYESSIEELQSVYDALLPRADEMLAYLNRFQLEALPADGMSLLYLTLTLAEISCAVERHQQPRVPNGFDTKRFTPFAPHGQIP